MRPVRTWLGACALLVLLAHVAVARADRLALTRGASSDPDAALILIDVIRRRHPDRFGWGPSIDRLTGSDAVRHAIDAGRLAPLLDDWDREADAFRRTIAPYLLYR